MTRQVGAQIGAAGGLVLDASVAIKLVVREDGSEHAARLLDGRPLYAPDFMGVEAANALWSMARRKTLSRDGAADAFDLLGRLPLASPPREVDLEGQALRLAFLLDHTVYDCVHLSMAVTLEIPVVTADRRFLAAARSTPETAPFVQPLEDAGRSGDPVLA